jgi:hypothetical protein
MVCGHKRATKTYAAFEEFVAYSAKRIGAMAAWIPERDATSYYKLGCFSAGLLWSLINGFHLKCTQQEHQKIEDWLK